MRPSAKEARSMRTTRTLSVLLVAVAVMMLLAPQVAPAQQTIRVYIDGRLAHFDVPPTIIQGRVLVPLRGVFEQLGAAAQWNAASQTILIGTAGAAPAPPPYAQPASTTEISGRLVAVTTGENPRIGLRHNGPAP